MPFAMSYWPVALTDSGWQQKRVSFCKVVFLREVISSQGRIVCSSGGGKPSPRGKL